MFDSRALIIQPYSAIPHAAGSCRVRTCLDSTSLSGTDVLVGVKLEVVENSSDSLFIQCSVDAPGGDVKNTHGQDSMASILEKALNHPQCMDFSKLRLHGASKLRWQVQLSVTVINDGGNVLDLSMMACYAALKSTRVPAINVDSIQDDNFEETTNEFEVLDDEQAMLDLPILDLPLFVTMYKIKDAFVVDASAEEQECSDAQLVVAITSRGRILFTQKTGHGAIKSSVLSTLVKKAVELGTANVQDIEQLLLNDKEQNMAIEF